MDCITNMQVRELVQVLGLCKAFARCTWKFLLASKGLESRCRS